MLCRKAMICFLVTSLSLALLPFYSHSKSDSRPSHTDSEKPIGVIVVPTPSDDCTKMGLYHKAQCKEILAAVKLAVETANKQATFKEHYPVQVARVEYCYDDDLCENQKADLKRKLRKAINAKIKQIAKAKGAEALLPFDKKECNGKHAARPQGSDAKDESDLDDTKSHTGKTSKRFVYLLGIIGHPYSGEAALYGDTYNCNGVLFISPSATNPKVTEDKDFVFSMSYDNNLQAKYMAYYLNQKAKDTLAPKSILEIDVRETPLRFHVVTEKKDGIILYDYENERDASEPVAKSREKNDWEEHAWEYMISPIIEKHFNYTGVRPNEIHILTNGNESKSTAKLVCEILRRRHYPIRIKVNPPEDPIKRHRGNRAEGPGQNHEAKFVLVHSQQIDCRLKAEELQSKLRKLCGDQNNVIKKTKSVYEKKWLNNNNGKNDNWKVIIIGTPDDWYSILEESLSREKNGKQKEGRTRKIVELGSEEIIETGLSIKQRVEVIRGSDPYAEDLYERLIKHYSPAEKQGGEEQQGPLKVKNGKIVGSNERDSNEIDLKLLARRLRDVSTVVLLTHADDVEAVHEEITKATANGIEVFGPDSLAKPALLKEIESESDRKSSAITLCVPFIQDVGNRNTRLVLDKIEERTKNTCSLYAPFAYDAASLILEALDNGYVTHQLIKSHESRPWPNMELRDYLKKLDSENPLLGVSGKICFNRNGHALRDGFIVSPTPERNYRYIPLDAVGKMNAVAFRTYKDRSSSAQSENPQDNQHAKQGHRNLTTPFIWIRSKFVRVRDIDISDGTFDAEFKLVIDCPTKILKYWKNRPEEDRNLMDHFQFPDVAWKAGDRDVKRVLSIFLETERSHQTEAGTEMKQFVFFCKGRFHSPYNLGKYPLDEQHLKIKVQVAKTDADREVFIPTWDRRGTQTGVETPGAWRHAVIQEPYGFFGSFFVPQVGPTCLTSYYTPVGEERQNQKGPGTGYVVPFKVPRDQTPPWLNILLPLSIVTFIGLLGMLVPVRRFEVRISLAITALLAVIIHHLSSMQQIRETGQETVADSLFILAYGGLLAVVIVVILVHGCFSKEKDSQIKSLDKKTWIQRDIVLETHADDRATSELGFYSTIAFIIIIILMILFAVHFLVFGYTWADLQLWG